MRQEFDKQLGKVKFSMALRERIIAMSFPVGEDILYVVTEPDSDYKTLPEKVLELLK